MLVRRLVFSRLSSDIFSDFLLTIEWKKSNSFKDCNKATRVATLVLRFKLVGNLKCLKLFLKVERLKMISGIAEKKQASEYDSD